jgi:hypothetical protein
VIEDDPRPSGSDRMHAQRVRNGQMDRTRGERSGGSPSSAGVPARGGSCRFRSPLARSSGARPQSCERVQRSDTAKRPSRCDRSGACRRFRGRVSWPVRGRAGQRRRSLRRCGGRRAPRRPGAHRRRATSVGGMTPDVGSRRGVRAEDGADHRSGRRVHRRGRQRDSALRRLGLCELMTSVTGEPPVTVGVEHRGVRLVPLPL